MAMRPAPLDTEKNREELIAENAALRQRLSVLESNTSQSNLHVVPPANKTEPIFDEIFENFPGVLYQWYERTNGDCGYSYISTHCIDYYGLTPDELIKDWRKLPIHPDDMLEWAESLKDAVENRSDWLFEGRFILPDGAVRWWRGVSKPVMVDQDEVVFNGILIDITDQRMAEDQLRENEERFELVLKSAELGMWDWSVQTGNVIYDDKWLEVLGYDAQELSDNINEWSCRIHPEDQAEVFRKISLSHQPWSSTFYEAEYRMKMRDNRWVWVLARGRVTEWGSCGEPVRMIGVMQDVTVRKKLETEFIKAKEDAEAADRTKSEFLAAMSHELRTPLNSIIGFTHLLLKRPTCRQHLTCEEFLKRISDNGVHLLGLINDVLDLSKIETGRAAVISQVVDMTSLVESVSLQFRYQFHKRGIAFDLELPDEAVFLKTDKQKLRQILQNLINNALKFTNAGKVEIRLKTSPVSGHPVQLEISDTGVGIPNDRISKIFLAFQQGEAGTARKYNGTGLGLAICQSLAQLLGYKLEVESTLGTGSTFRLVFDSLSN